MLPSAPSFINTSIAAAFLPLLDATHRRRRISAFTGPPGIGKSTALEAFRSSEDWAISVVSVPPGPKSGLGSIAALQIAIEGLAGVIQPRFQDRVPSSRLELRNRLYSLICEWIGLGASEVRRDSVRPEDVPPLTLVFDEAQNLSREAIETLRYLNDATGNFSPFPVGLIFVGNNEFVLKSDARGQSTLSAAVADRALWIEDFKYTDVTDRDLELYLAAHGVMDPDAMALVIRCFGSGRRDRSFRRVNDLIAELIQEAGKGPVTAATVRCVLQVH